MFAAVCEVMIRRGGASNPHTGSGTVRLSSSARSARSQTMSVGLTVQSRCGKLCPERSQLDVPRMDQGGHVPL